MPWRETHPMDQRQQFVREAVRRHEELSRRPHRSPEAAEAAVLLLKRHGLITSPRRRRALGHPGRPMSPMTEPNAVWTADFKGQFRTRDERLCYPLTIADGASRYLLACRALRSVKTGDTRPLFERAFREYGLPERIRTDNGGPFATIALGRLSPLNVWWLRLEIRPELIQPGHPEQNGRHERKHRTLTAETQRRRLAIAGRNNGRSIGFGRRSMRNGRMRRWGNVRLRRFTRRRPPFSGSAAAPGVPGALAGPPHEPQRRDPVA